MKAHPANQAINLQSSGDFSGYMAYRMHINDLHAKTLPRATGNTKATMLHKAAALGADGEAIAFILRNEPLVEELANAYEPITVDSPDSFGNTAYLTAVFYDRMETAQALLEAGANPNIQNRDGQTILHMMSEKGRADIVKKLLESGSNPEIEDNGKNTALHLAARRGHVETVKELLGNGAEIGGALPAAVYNGHVEVASLLLERGAEIGDALRLAVGLGHVGVVSLFLEKGAQIGGVLPLAARNGHVEVASLLLEKGAKMYDALPQAALNGYGEIVKLLLDNKADPDVKEINGVGWTSLHCAVQNDQIEMALMLLEKGADPEIRGKGDHLTAMDIAERENNREIATLLFSHGAKVPQQWENYWMGDFTLIEATEQGNIREIWELVTRNGAEYLPETEVILCTRAKSAAREIEIQTLNPVVEQSPCPSSSWVERTSQKKSSRAETLPMSTEQMAVATGKLDAFITTVSDTDMFSGEESQRIVATLTMAKELIKNGHARVNGEAKEACLPGRAQSIQNSNIRVPGSERRQATL